jgi:hypothetical protein
MREIEIDRRDRVIRVGVASGAGPLQLVPGALDHFEDNDRAGSSASAGTG